MKLSDNLKTIRKENNLSQEQLAEKLGVSRQAVSKWESDQSYPEMEKVLLICKLFNYNIDELMNESVKEVNETKQSKSNLNKYIDDFFSFITKTVEMLSSMKFKEKLKCIFEQIIVVISLLMIFAIIGAILEGILGNLLIGRISGYYTIRDILGSIYMILALIVGVAIFLHIFKIRYLDYYEIVKEDNYSENSKNEEETTIEDDKIIENKKEKQFIEKKKEKIIIRDPNHSEMKFLNGIMKFFIWCIKFLAIYFGIFFAFTFIGLVMMLVLSFMFVKTGLVFFGALLGIFSALAVNYIILHMLYNFIVNKKSKKHIFGVIFISSLLLAGIGIGLICIGMTGFNYVEGANEIEETYNIEMTDGLIIDTPLWSSKVEYIETDTDEIKIVVKHSKYNETRLVNVEKNHIKIYYYQDNTKVMENIRDMVKDLNNKEIRSYDSIPEIYVYTSKSNFESIKKPMVIRW